MEGSEGDPAPGRCPPAWVEARDPVLQPGLARGDVGGAVPRAGHAKPGDELYEMGKWGKGEGFLLSE